VKPIFATLSSLAVLVTGWIIMAILLSLIGAIASQAHGGVGLLHLIHVFLIWVLSPGIGGFFALYVTALLFNSVSTHTIYVSFVSATAVILAVLLLAGIVSIRLGESPLGSLILFALQAAAIFLGARVGKAAADDVRPAASMP
jgi:hypothetical protein